MIRTKRELMGQEVASAIRELILSGEVNSGDVLRLAPLAERLEMSITPVREALVRLSQDGWVAHEPNRGFRVVPIRRQDVVDTYWVWSMAEGELAARAACRSTRENIAVLRHIDGRLRNLSHHDSPMALELNADLHSAVHELADAPKLLWFVDGARRLVPFRFDSSFYSVPGWAEINRFGHTEIIDCIEAGDAENARRLMHEHLQSTCDLLLKWLDSLAFWQESEASTELGRTVASSLPSTR